MLNSPVVILVGGPNTGKTRFYTEFTNSVYYHPTTKSTPNVTMWRVPGFVLVDTPGIPHFRNKFEYSWQGMFRVADVIVMFGNWSESEIHGEKLKANPKYLTWSGDNEETMKRIEEYLQERR